MLKALPSNVRVFFSFNYSNIWRLGWSPLRDSTLGLLLALPSNVRVSVSNTLIFEGKAGNLMGLYSESMLRALPSNVTGFVAFNYSNICNKDRALTEVYSKDMFQALPSNVRVFFTFKYSNIWRQGWRPLLLGDAPSLTRKYKTRGGYWQWPSCLPSCIIYYGRKMFHSTNIRYLSLTFFHFFRICWEEVSGIRSQCHKTFYICKLWLFKIS